MLSGEVDFLMKWWWWNQWSWQWPQWINELKYLSWIDHSLAACDISATWTIKAITLTLSSSFGLFNASLIWLICWKCWLISVLRTISTTSVRNSYINAIIISAIKCRGQLLTSNWSRVSSAQILDSLFSCSILKAAETWWFSKTERSLYKMAFCQ